MSGSIKMKQRRYRAMAALVPLATLVAGVGAAAPRSSHAAHHLYHVAIGIVTPYPILTVNKFVPDKLVIHAGDSVQWTNTVGSQAQTVTFGPVENTPSLLLSPTEINPLVARAQGGHSVDNVSLNVYSSGALMSGVSGLATSYTFTFPKQGTYYYRSLFHPLTLGEIDVVASNKTASSDQPDRGNSAIDALRSASTALQDASSTQVHGADTNSGGADVLVGFGNNNVSVNEFAPAGIVVPVGGSVTWRIKESSGDLHELVFNPTTAENAGQVRLFSGLAGDGGLKVNGAYVKATLPTAAQVTTDTLSSLQQTSNGRWTSGLLYGSSPAYMSQVPTSYTLTFMAPGRYSYVDPFHFGMVGVVNVVNVATSS